MMRNLSIIACRNNRSAILLMSVGALGLGLTAVILANTLRLDACHLCIFQRLVYFVIGAVLLIAFIAWNRPLLRVASLVVAAAISAWGMAVAVQQSWLQWFPESGLSCNVVEPGITERLIDWLGDAYPMFFMATGFCGSKDLVILGLSLANWSFLVLSSFFLGSIGLALLGKRSHQPDVPLDALETSESTF
jgi:disulfide bond formation protein DsbB